MYYKNINIDILLLSPTLKITTQAWRNYTGKYKNV